MPASRTHKSKDNTMKIAHIIPHSVTFPLELHNGRYDWVVNLASIQSKAGHNVTIYCNPDSRLSGITTDGIVATGNDKKLNNINTFKLAFSNDHDIYHSHFDNLHYEVATDTDKPILFTQHWWPTTETTRLAHSLSRNNVWAVPPTQHMYAIDIKQGIPTKGFIYHGIDLISAIITPVKKTGRLLFVGRIAPEKNLITAINMANNANLGLDIIGKVAQKNQEYWQTILPYIDGSQIRYLGAKDHKDLGLYYASAAALVFPSDINEPFGLVAIESQMYGTPVIMWRGGSRGELIKDGETGYLCDNEKDFINAALKSHTLDPNACISFAKNFDVQVMALKYDELYKSLINNHNSY